jgi:ubiquinone/menaquinone biosynthesis C-methylase UbiE
MSDEVKMAVWPGKKLKPQPPLQGVRPFVQEAHDPFADGPAPPTSQWSDEQQAYVPIDPRTKYRGEVAAGYDTKRDEQPRWHEEQAIIEGMLDDFPNGTKVLDVPIGTGRFLGAYQRRRFVVVGVDISLDMLKQAEAKLLPGSIDCRLYQGDIREVSDEFPPMFFDVTVMCRMTRWLSPEDCRLVIQKLAAITRKRIIFTARVANHPHARPFQLFRDALPHWYISKAEAVASDPHYYVIAMEPAAPRVETDTGAWPGPMVDPFADQLS